MVFRGVDLGAKEGSEDVKGVDELTKILLLLSFSILRRHQNPITECQCEALPSIASRSPGAQLTPPRRKVHLEGMIYCTDSAHRRMEVLRPQPRQRDTLLHVDQAVLVTWNALS